MKSLGQQTLKLLMLSCLHVGVLTAGQAPLFTHESQANAYLAQYAAHTPLGFVRALRDNEHEGNGQDLKRLWELVRAACAAGACPTYSALEALVNHDRAAYQRAEACYTETKTQDSRWSFHFGTFLQKLLGSSTVSGLLDDSLSQYNRTLGQGKFEEVSSWLNPEIANEVTQFKVLGVYLLSLLRGEPLTHMHLPLSGVVPAHYWGVSGCDQGLKGTVLYGRMGDRAMVSLPEGPTLHSVGMGYALGANYLSYVTKGVGFAPYYVGDCSALISTVYQFPLRMATFWMCQVRPNHSRESGSLDPAVRQIEEWFDVVPLEEVESGDVVVWCPGHTGFFLGWAEETHAHMYVLDSGRSEDKKIEGLALRVRETYLKKETKILRLRESFKPTSFLRTVKRTESGMVCVYGSETGDEVYPCTPAPYGGEEALPIKLSEKRHEL